MVSTNMLIRLSTATGERPYMKIRDQRKCKMKLKQ